MQDINYQLCVFGFGTHAETVSQHDPVMRSIYKCPLELRTGIPVICLSICYTVLTVSLINSFY